MKPRKRSAKRRPNNRKPKPVDIFVGHRVRATRVARNISQQSLVDALGVTRQQIQKYESGADRLSVSSIYAISKFLGCDIAWFFPAEEDAVPPQPDKFAEIASTAGGHRLVAAYLAISDAKHRAAVVALVEAFVEKKDG
jgi:transcriptional regulator with XRE-family HTH domain